MFAHLTSTPGGPAGGRLPGAGGHHEPGTGPVPEQRRGALQQRAGAAGPVLCRGTSSRSSIWPLTGTCSPIGSSMYPAFQKYFVEDLTDYYSYDPDRARELLAEAGYPDGFSMTITVPSNYQPHIDTATVLVGAAAGGGHHSGDPARWTGVPGWMRPTPTASSSHGDRRGRLQHDRPGPAGAVRLHGGRQLYQLSERGL